MECFFKQTLKVMENIYRDIAVYDTIYLEFKDLCRKALEEIFNFLCIQRSTNRDQGRYCIYNETKYTYIKCTPETVPF